MEAKGGFAIGEESGIATAARCPTSGSANEGGQRGKDIDSPPMYMETAHSFPGCPDPK